MPTGPRPMTKAGIRAMERDRKIYEHRKAGNTWAEVGVIMGLEGATCETYLRRAMQKFKWEPFEGTSGHSVQDRDPQAVANILAGAALGVDDDTRFTRLREVAKEAGIKPAVIAGLIKRIKTDLAPVVDAARGITVPEMTKELEKKISLIFHYMDEYSVSQASLKDLAIAANVAIEKHQLLSNRPTHIIDFTSRQQLNVIMPQLMAEAKRRGITVDSVATRVDEPR